ncbi:MAG: tetratricopeptide repeat protein, partial [Bacteroidetes bacterium]|nr:tetratricopeptide repeat protein [Bacteroidota bacterium]
MKVDWRKASFLLALLSAGILSGRSSGSVLYVSQVLLHAGAGCVLAGIWLFDAWRISKQSLTLMRFVRVLSYLVASISGLGILIVGVVHPFEWVLWLHIPSAIIATLCIVVGGWREGRSDLQVQTVRRWVQPARIVFALFVILAVWNRVDRGYSSIQNEILGPMSLADAAMGGAEGPFFPSSVATVSGDLIPADFFLESQSCGRSGCHVDALAQWESSAHRFSSFNNQWYRKSIEYMQEFSGTQGAQWCAGCHDPALLFSGAMNQPVKDFIDTPEAHAGVTCLACHAIKQVRNTAGNGSYDLEVPTLHAIATHENPVVQFIHDRMLLADPAPHREAFLKPFMVKDQAAFCSSCHKVHLDAAVNDYRWLRGFNTYDNWQASGISGEGARSFYQPLEPQLCTDCHMTATPSTDPGADHGTIKNHQFIAANTALPVANDDSLQLNQTVAFLEQGHLTVDIFGLVPMAATSETAVQPVPSTDPLRTSTSFAVGEERGMDRMTGWTSEAQAVTGPLENNAKVLEPGKAYRLDVVVRSRNVGHFFPTGTTDAQEAWLEVQITDDNGTMLLQSGGMTNGIVDPTAHFYRNVLVDEAGQRIDKRNAFAARGAVYVNLIPPGGADVAHYLVQVPDGFTGSLHVSARLNYRKFTEEYTRFAFGGEFDEPFDPETMHFGSDPRKWTYKGVSDGVSSSIDTLPVLPIARMAADSVSLAAGAKGGDASGDGDHMRWNDYGIALIREGDLSTARLAFERVTKIAPEYADGWINAARVDILQGALGSAQEALKEAETRQPGYYKTAYFRGLVFKLMGDYSAAIEEFNTVLTTHPRDRVVLNDLGRSLYLSEDLDA